jgi:hypothetical protein
MGEHGSWFALRWRLEIMPKTYSVEDQIKRNRLIAQQFQSGNASNSTTADGASSIPANQSSKNTEPPVLIEDATGRPDALAFQPIVRSVKSRDR